MKNRTLALFSLFFCSALVYAAPSFDTDERKLQLKLDSQSFTISVPELVQQAAPEKITVYDIDFDEQRAYWAISWPKLMSALGIAPETIQAAGQLSFVCLDGYTVNADSAEFLKKTQSAWLALASAERPAANEPGLIQGRWRPLMHGDRATGFDPFYLIWSGVDNATAEQLPWPYQLAEIHVLGANSYASLKPAPTLKTDKGHAQVQSGFEHYVNHCIRCHKIDGIGGDMGGDILQHRAYVFFLGKEKAVDLMKNIRRYRPDTKMPDYSDTLSDEAWSALWAYLVYRKEHHD